MKVVIKNKKFITNANVVICILEAGLDSSWCDTDDVEVTTVQITGDKRQKINGNGNPAYRRLHFKGVAKCNANDTFNEIVGKNIAEKRAMIKLYSYYKKFIKECCEKAEKNLNKFKALKDSLEEKENTIDSELITLLMEV